MFAAASIPACLWYENCFWLSLSSGLYLIILSLLRYLFFGAFRSSSFFAFLSVFKVLLVKQHSTRYTALAPEADIPAFRSETR